MECNIKLIKKSRRENFLGFYFPSKSDIPGWRLCIHLQQSMPCSTDADFHSKCSRASNKTRPGSLIPCERRDQPSVPQGQKSMIVLINVTNFTGMSPFLNCCWIQFNSNILKTEALLCIQRWPLFQLANLYTS